MESETTRGGTYVVVHHRWHGGVGGSSSNVGEGGFRVVRVGGGHGRSPGTLHYNSRHADVSNKRRSDMYQVC